MRIFKIQNLLILFLLLSSCSTLQHNSPQLRIPASSSSNETCIEILKALTNKDISHLVANQLRDEFPEYQKEVVLDLYDINKYGYWKFRSKKIDSINSKLNKKEKRGAQFSDTSQARALINDGLGARFILEDASLIAREDIIDTIEKAVISNELDLIEIRNFRMKSGHAYFSDEQILRLQDASEKNGISIVVKTGKDAITPIGYYTSTHLRVRTSLGTISEIQIRGEQINQFSEIAHIFYDIIQGKSIPPMLAADTSVLATYKLIIELTPKQQELYKQYIQDASKYFRGLEEGANSQRGPPPLPRGLKSKKQLAVLSIWKRIGKYFDNGSTSRSLINYDEKNEIFDAIQTISNNHSVEDARDVIGNVFRGKRYRIPLKEVEDQLAETKVKMDGLRYFEIIPWKEGDRHREKRKTIRAGLKWAGKIDIPKYKKNQKIWETELKIGEIHFMQAKASNSSGEFTVISNARALKDGTLLAKDLPPLEVWKDESGKIWSMDHRRLAAYELSGNVEIVPVKFVSEEEVISDTFKYSTLSDGKSIIMEIKDTPLAYIVKKK
jgi:hypothetical protein